MPWLKKTMKDVAACDKPRLGGKQPLIRGCPNGETCPAEGGTSAAEYIGSWDDYPANWNILVAGGKEKNHPSLKLRMTSTTCAPEL